MSWIRGVLVAIDHAGGNPDATISARTGYFANENSNKTFIHYWRFIESIINVHFIH